MSDIHLRQINNFFSQNLNQNYHYENNIIFIDKTIYIQQYLQEL